MTRHILSFITISILASFAFGCGNNDDGPPKKKVPVFVDMDMDTVVDMPDMGDMKPDMVITSPNAITVADQTLTTDVKVSVASVSSSGPGWVVIHADDGAGAPGEVLGQTQVRQDTTTDVEVTLSRPATDQETLHAMLHKDAPADDQYTFDGQNGEDPPAVDDQDKVVVESFVVTVDATNITPSVDVEDQMLNDNSTVLIKLAVSNGPGWIVIHEESNGDIGGVIGKAFLTSGSNQDIVVTLDRPVQAAERLFAMLHKDDPADGNYTFDGQNGEDGPVLNENSQPIAPPFIATPKSSGFDPVVEVDNQTLTTPTDLIIKRVVSDGPGWVVIHEDDNGSIGPVIGRGFVGNGESTFVDVTLNRDAVDQEKLYAMLHKDAPADGRYTFTAQNGEDAPVMKMGMPVAPPFTVTVPTIIEPALNVPPVIDVTTPREITVPSAVSNGPGWVVIYEKDVNGTRAGVIGKRAIPTGTSMDISITLDRDIVNGETIVMQLHKDDPADNMFTNDTNAAEDLQVKDAQGLDIGGETVLVTPQPSLSVFAQNISDLSTVITVNGVTALNPGWVIVRESDNQGNPGAIIGQASVPVGSTNDLNITLTRPSVDSEILFVTLHDDAPADNVYDPNADPIVQDDQGIEIEQVFSPLLDPGVPAVRFTLVNMGASSYQFTQVEPVEFIGAVSALNGDNPTLTLQRGWRYAFVNNGFPAHPVEFIKAGATRAGDTVLLSQDGGVTGTLEADMNIEWSTDMKTVTFTTPNQPNQMDGYRCSVAGHVNMRGTINTQ